MKKHRRRNDGIAPTAGMPDRKQQMRWSAESMAETAMRTDPAMKKARDHITEEVMKAGMAAAKHAMGRMHKKKPEE